MMIIIASHEEKELLTRLRQAGVQEPETKAALTAEILTLKTQVTNLKIEKDRLDEKHAREERELRHMIGLEKRRQEVEMEQAKKEAMLNVREENLKTERARFEEQLRFNTSRFETMEKYLKDMMGNILERLPNVTVALGRELSRGSDDK